MFPILFVVSACTGGVGGGSPGPALPPLEQDSCEANSRADLVGQDATALERVLIIGQVRVIRPGMAVTMDFRPERINFEIDTEGRIVRIYCG